MNKSCFDKWIHPAQITDKPVLEFRNYNDYNCSVEFYITEDSEKMPTEIIREILEMYNNYEFVKFEHSFYVEDMQINFGPYVLIGEGPRYEFVIYNVAEYTVEQICEIVSEEVKNMFKK